MGKGTNEISTKVTVSGGDEAVGKINAITSALSNMNAVVGGTPGTGSLAVRNSPIAPFAPQAPAPPSVSASSPTFSTHSSFNPSTLAYAIPGLLGANGYAASSQSIIPPAPLPPGQRNIGPSLASGGFGGNSPASGMPLHISAQTVTITATVVNVVGGGTMGGGDTSSSSSTAGSGRGNSSFGSGSGGSAALIPRAPAPPGGGSGGGNGGGNGQIPDEVPEGGGPSWGKFWKNVRANPSIGGVLNAAKNEMPVGPAAAVTAAMYGFSYAGNAIYAGQRPGFENQLSQTSGMLHGQYTPSALLAGQARAAEIRGSMAYDKSLLAPFNAATFGLAGLAYDFTTGQPREEAAMRAEGDAAATQNIRQLSALGGVSNAGLLQRFGNTTRVKEDLGFIGNWQRTIAQESGAANIRGDVGGMGIGGALMGYLRHAANAGYHDERVLDENSAKYLPSMIQMQRMAMGMGQGFDNRTWNDANRFRRSFGTAFDVFGSEGTVASYGGVASAMGNDPSQVGMYRAGTNFADPENIRLAARVAASRGQDLTGFAPAYTQINAMGEFGSLRDTRRGMQILQNQDTITSYNLSGAGSRYREKEESGADYKTLQEELRTQIEYLKAQKETRTAESKFAITDSDKAKFGSEINALSEAITSSVKRVIDVEFQAKTTGVNASGLSASTAYSKVLYSGGDANALSAANKTQSNVTRQRAALLRQQSLRKDLDPMTRQMLAAQAEEQEQQAGTLAARQDSQTTYGLDMSLAGVTRARAGQAGSLAHLFGGPNEQAAAVRQERDATAQELKAVSDQIARGNLSLDELRKLTAQQVGLQTRQVELAQEEIRGKAQAEYSLASGRAGLASTEASTAFSMGAGGAAGGRLAIGTLRAQKGAVQKAQAYVALLQQQGVSQDNPAYLQAQQTLASARQQEASLTVGLANTPYSVGLRRQEENASYQTDILSALPGSYGNLRGAMRKQMSAYQGEAQELHDQYAQVAQQFGGEANIPEATRAGFEARMHSLGRNSASLARSLAYGWESKLVSQTLGTNGNFAYTQNRFTSDRSAVMNGVRNPHFGSTGADLSYFIHDANGDPGYGLSLAGSTGTPQGLARTALTGAKQRNDFSEGAAFPLHMAGGGALLGAGGGRGAAGGSEPMGMIRVEVTVKSKEDGTILRTETQNIRVDKLSLGANEDAANFFSQQMRGQ